MFKSNRNVLSVAIMGLSGIALWQLPNHVRGDNQLFGANGTLLPALALSIICALAGLGALRNMFGNRRNAEAAEGGSDDVQFGRASVYGILLVTLLACFFTVSLRTIGYIPAGFILVLALMFGTGGRNAGKNMIISALAVVLLYTGIRYGLGVHLTAWPDIGVWAD